MNKIWFCGYRGWALSIYEHLMRSSSRQDIPVILIKDQHDYSIMLENLDVDDIVFFIGWSWIIPKEIVNNYTCICLHPSPLPKYRGGSPLQHQIINGEAYSAATFFVMDEHIDKGPILFTKSFDLDGSLDSIYQKIINCGKEGITEITTQYADGHLLHGTPQDESQKSYYRRRTPAMSEIKKEDFANMTATQLYNKVRALQDPYPNAFVNCKDNTRLLLKVVQAEE